MPDLDSLLKSAGSPTPKRKFSRGIRPDHVSRGETLPPLHEETVTKVVATETVTTPLTSSHILGVTENNPITPNPVSTSSAATKEAVTEMVSADSVIANRVTTETVSTKVVTPNLEITEKVTTNKAATKAVHTEQVTTKKVSANLGATYTPAALPNFTRIPNQVMACLEREDFSTRELRILMVIIRETLGWGRAFAELSMSDIAKRTNISQPKIPAAISELEGRGAIIRERQEKQGKNRYAVCASFFQKWVSTDPVSAGMAVSTEMVTTEQGTEVSTNMGAGESYQSGSSVQTGFSNKSSHLEPENASLNKVIKERSNKSLSQEEIFEERFSELIKDHSAKSREREFEKFKNLTSQFPNESETILEVAAAVKSRGVDLRGQPIGSLMAYLELAYTQERSPFLESKEKAQSRDARAKSEQQAKIREEEELEAAEKTFLANFERFKSEIPDHEDRMNLVRELCADAIWLKDPGSPAALRIAVSKWALTN